MFFNRSSNVNSDLKQAYERALIRSLLIQISKLEEMASEESAALQKFRGYLSNTAHLSRAQKTLASLCHQYLEATGKNLGEYDQLLRERPNIRGAMQRFGITPDNLWKLGIDRKDHNHSNGRLVYDLGREVQEIIGNQTVTNYAKGEEGCVDALETALMFVMDTADMPITVEYIKLLHMLATNNVKGFMGGDLPENYQQALQRSKFFPGGMPIIEMNRSLAGLSELKRWAIENDGEVDVLGPGGSLLSQREPSEFLEVSKCVSVCNGNPEGLIQKFITEYDLEIEQASSGEARDLALIKLLKKLDFAHSFGDGNMRLNVLLDLKESIRRGMAPTSYQNPNLMDAQSSDEIAQQKREGRNWWIEHIMESSHREMERENIGEDEPSEPPKSPKF